MQADERFFYFSENGSSAFDEPVHARNICDFRDLHSRRLRIGVIFGCAGIAGAMLLRFPGAPARIQPMQVGRGETHMHQRMKNALIHESSGSTYPIYVHIQGPGRYKRSRKGAGSHRLPVDAEKPWLAGLLQPPTCAQFASMPRVSICSCHVHG